MPVNTAHPAYSRMTPRWKLVRDVINGDTTVKQAGPEYLPVLSEQANDRYDAYKMRADFLEITKRTAATFLGFIYRVDPSIKYPTIIQEFIDDATLTGLSWYAYLKQRVREVINIGRGGTLIDWDEVAARPFVKPYDAEDIINWKVDRVGKKVALVLLVLRERSTKWVDDGSGKGAPDPYETVEYTQWRELQLLTNSADGVPYVSCRVWRKYRANDTADTPDGAKPARGKRGTGPAVQTNRNIGDGEFFQSEPESMPSRRGLPLNQIAFVFHGPNNSMPDIDEIPMEGMAKINLSLYRTSADLENGRHFTGLPQFYAFGIDDDKIRLGSTKAIVAEDATKAQIGFAEVTGEFGALSKAVEQKKMDMASLGARLLDYEKKDAEAFETHKMRQTGETVTLGNISIAGTEAGTMILCWVAWWYTAAATPESCDGVANTELNMEFADVSVDAQQWSAANTARGSNLISARAYYEFLRQSNVYPTDWSYEDEQDELDKAGLPGMMPNAMIGGNAKPISATVVPPKRKALPAG